MECPGCGAFQTLILKPGYNSRCRRCQATLRRPGGRTVDVLALGATALILLGLANAAPMMAIRIAGRGQGVRLESGVSGLATHGLPALAVFVMVISLLAPLGRVFAILGAILTLRSPLARRRTAWLLRVAERLRPWSMLDVFLVGALIALTKLHGLAQVRIGLGFWALGGLVVALAAFEASIDRGALWAAVRPGPLAQRARGSPAARVPRV